MGIQICQGKQWRSRIDNRASFFGENLEAELKRLHLELKTKAYKAKPSSAGGGIPCRMGARGPLEYRDGQGPLVQQAPLNILQPIFEPGLSSI